MHAPASDSTDSSASRQIRENLAFVEILQRKSEQLGLRPTVLQVKQLQADRFRATYRDLLNDPRHAPATRFFLEELYGAADFGPRDRQFGRIAAAIERVFPASVVQIAVDLASLHALTESLDHDMADHWRSLPASTPLAKRYVQCWKCTGSREDRERQLAVVVHMGTSLQAVVRTPGLRLALKLMRRPAQAAGLSALQCFLERGFDAFAHMGDASQLLTSVQEREHAWIDRLFDEEDDSAARALDTHLASTVDASRRTRPV